MRFPSVPPVVGAAQTARVPIWQTAACKQAVVAVWLLGAAVALLRLLAGLIAMRRITACETESDPVLSRMVTHLQHELGMGRAVAVRKTRTGSALPVPLTWGLFRPMLLLPSIFVEWPQERRRMVLLHELAHIQRADWLVQILVQITRALYWFHPLVWWTTYRLQAESERACDDTVLLAGIAPSAYAEALLEVLRTMHRPKPSVLAPGSLLSMARPPIESRLRAVLSPQRRQGPSRRLTLWASASAAIGTIVLASVQGRAVPSPASYPPPPGVSHAAGGSAVPSQSAVSPAPVAGQERLAANRQSPPVQAIVAASATESAPRAEGDDIPMLRAKLDTLELLLMQSQQENAALHRQIDALEARKRRAADLIGAQNSDAPTAQDHNGATTGQNIQVEGIKIKGQGKGIRIEPNSLIGLSVPQSLQIVLRDLRRQSSLESTLGQANQDKIGGTQSAANANEAKAKLAACKLQIDAVQKQIDAVKAKRTLSQKEVEFGMVCLRIAGDQALLQREQARLVGLQARFQAGAVRAGALSNAERSITQIQARLDEAKARFSQATAH